MNFFNFPVFVSRACLKILYVILNTVLYFPVTFRFSCNIFGVYSIVAFNVLRKDGFKHGTQR